MTYRNIFIPTLLLITYFENLRNEIVTYNIFLPYFIQVIKLRSGKQNQETEQGKMIKTEKE